MRRFAPRILAVVLSACLILPPHAYALRPQQRETKPQRAGLEETLRSGDPDALLQVASSGLAQWISPASAAAPGLPVEGSSTVPMGRVQTGLEELLESARPILASKSPTEALLQSNLQALRAILARYDADKERGRFVKEALPALAGALPPEEFHEALALAKTMFEKNFVPFGMLKNTLPNMAKNPERFPLAFAFVSRLVEKGIYPYYASDGALPAVDKASPTLEIYRIHLGTLEDLITTMYQRKVDLDRTLRRAIPAVAEGVAVGWLAPERFTDGLDLALRISQEGKEPAQALQLGLPMAAQIPSGQFKEALEALFLLAVHPRFDFRSLTPSQLEQFAEQVGAFRQQGIEPEVQVIAPEVRIVPLEAIAVVAPLAELISQLVSRVAEQREKPGAVRFIVDTSRGDSRVLHLLQLAVELRLKRGLLVEAAGVATGAELSAAQAQLADPASRRLLEDLVYTYVPGDEASHQTARALAEALIPQLPSGSIITEIDRSTIAWFLEALERLGVGELSEEIRQQVEAVLTAA